MSQLSWLLAAVFLFGCATARAAALAPGDKAPPFSLPGSDGKTWSLSDFVGKKAVVLAWFPKAFTSGWTRECKSLRESGDKIREFDVAYFAASTDSLEKDTEFAKELGVDYPILADPQKKVAESYGVLTPLIGVAKRWTFYIGKDGKLLYVDRDVNTNTAGADVAARLATLGVAKKAGGGVAKKAGGK